ncbi:MAG: HNH endonuclease signature motif containing protein [Acidimicrobiales bacterium]
MVATTLHSELVSELREVVGRIQQLVRAASPESVSGDEALTVTGLFGDAERAAASGIALFSPVVARTGSFAKVGHGSAADWLGTVSGTSAGTAKGRLTAAKRAASNPRLTEALHDAKLSTSQLKVLSDTAAAAPESTDTLLGLTEQGASHQELSDAAARIHASVRSRETERARRARVHELRHFRWRQSPDGGIRGEFLCDEVAWARVSAGLEADAKERWKAAGKGEPLDAHRLDAFLAALGGAGGAGGAGGVGGGTARPHTLVIVDAEALRRGTTAGDELCEIEGIGPVSVQAANELIGEGGLQFLVKEGVDIRTVTSTRRAIPQRVAAALIVRDRSCAAGCGKRLGLEGDHRLVDFGDDGPTELANLARLCPECHDLKTYGGWRLEGAPGRWKWVAPAHPKSAFYIARARQLAAAKAKARAEARRNDPLRR